MQEKSFDQMIIENKDFLMPFSLSFTKNEEEAKDLVQDTVYRALVYRDKFHEGTNIKAWLYTIMRNIFINNYRRQKKFTKVSSETPQDFYLYQMDKMAHNNGIVNFGVREIKKAINMLPDVFRLSFEMHYLGYKYQEIADTLNEPLGTIKSRIHIARKMLTYKISRY